MQIFDVASRHMDWLAIRQRVSASNIANANTPGYRAQSVASFETFMPEDMSGLTLTSPAHLQAASAGSSSPRITREPGWDIAPSQNDVTLEQELGTAGETSRMMSLDANLTRSFHRMLLSSLKV